MNVTQRSKVKGTDIYNIDTYRETRTAAVHNKRSGVLTGTSSRRRRAISGSPLPERTNVGPAIAALQTHLFPSQPHYIWPSPRNVLWQRLTIWHVRSRDSSFSKLVLDGHPSKYFVHPSI